MSDINNPRTLSGVNQSSIRQIQLPSTEDAILIDGNEGLPNQGIFKNAVSNKLEWDFAESTSIPDGSISGAKLKPDITINTSGDINANTIKGTTIATDTLNLPENGASTAILNGAGLSVYEGGDISLYDGAGVRRIWAEGGAGDIKVFNPAGSQTIDVDGATGNINMNLGGHIDLFDGGGNIAIELNGSNGIVECRDINVSAHTGTILFNEVKTDKLTITKSVDEVIIDGNGITTSSGNDISCGGDITAINGRFTQIEVPSTGAPDVFISANGITTSAGTDVLCGGELTGKSALITNGLGTAVVACAGDVDATRQIKSTRVGANPPPTDNTYTEFGLDLTTTTTHAHIGGNLICDGTIFANIEGSITEEVVDCQRLNIRTDPTGATGGATGITITGTGATLAFVGDAGNTGIDLAQRIIVSTNNLINISGNNGNLTATGDITIGSAASKTILVGSNGGNQTYNNSCDDITIGSSTGLGVNTTIGINGNTTILQNDQLIRGNGNILNGIYRNALSLFDMRGNKITHSLNGTQRTTTCLRASADRTQLIPNNKTALITDTGYLAITGFNLKGIIATATSCRIHFETYFLVSTGNPDLYCRIDDTDKKTNAPYASQTHPHLLKNTAGTSAFNQRTTETILITGLVVGDSLDFFPRFATTSSASCNFKYGGVYGDALLSYVFLEDVDISDPLDPALLSGDDY